MPLPKAAKQKGPRSLQRMCIAVAIRSIASITDIGDIPLEVAKPILRHIENPVQLHELETQCPQLGANPDQMAEIWTRLISKKFPKWEKERESYPFEDDMSWFEMYCVIKETIDAANAAATAQLQQKLAGFDKAKQAGHTTLMVNNQALLKKMPGINVRRRGGPGSSAGSFSFGGGQRTKMTTGQSVLKRVRREVKEISNVSHLSTPTASLRVARGQIRKAPEAMVHDYRVAHNPEMVIRAPRKRTASFGNGIDGITEDEARLLALKAGSQGAAAAAAAAAAGGAGSGSGSKSVAAPRPAASKGIIPPRKRRLEADDEDQRPAKRSHRQYENAYEEDLDGMDDMDDLFGDAPQKKPRLTAEDLERSFEASSISPKKAKASSSSSSSRGPGSSRPVSGVLAQALPFTAKRPARKLREDDDDDDDEPPRRRTQTESDTKSPQRPLKPPPRLNPSAAKSSPARASGVVDSASSSRPVIRRSPPPNSGMVPRKRAKPTVFMQPKRR